MLFRFHPELFGWYPGQIRKDFWRFSTTEAAMIAHDFIDHGPDADFSLEDEWRALGSSRWTGLVRGTGFGSDNPDAYAEAFDKGFREAQARYPGRVMISQTMQERLTEKMRKARADALIAKPHERWATNHNIVLHIQCGIVDFSGVGY